MPPFHSGGNRDSVKDCGNALHPRKLSIILIKDSTAHYN